MIDAELSGFLLGLVGHHLWQGALLTLLIAVALRFARRYSAGTRYGIWNIALIAVVALPLLALVPRPELSTPAAAAVRAPIIAAAASPGNNVEATPAAIPALVSETGAQRAPDNAASLLASLGKAATRLQPWAALVLMGCWIGGSALMLFNLLRRAGTARRLRRTATVCRGPVAAWFRGESGKATRGRTVELLESRDVTTPLALGFLRPAVVLPAGFNDRFAAREARHVLLHELAHVARRDQWAALWQKIAVALFFFHPAVRFMDRQLVREREAACDDWAVARTGDTRGYAECLLRVCESSLLAARANAPERAPLLAMGVITKQELTHRVDNMLNDLRDHRTQASLFTLATFGLACLLAVGSFSLLLPTLTFGDTVETVPSLVSTDAVDATEIDETAPATSTRSALSAETAPRKADIDDAKERTHRSSSIQDIERSDDASSAGTRLILAAWSGDRDEVQRLLDTGADPNASVSSNRTPRSPLNAAARAGHVGIAQLLLDRGADVDLVVRGDATPLMAACREGQLEVARLLLDRGADVHRKLSGDGTALINAARSGNAELVELLLERGADPDTAVSGDGTALIAASNHWNDEIVQLLLDHGADVDTAVSGDGNPLINAAATGRSETVRTLIDAGADVNRAVSGDGTPLIVAARRGDAQVVRDLLERGADPNRGVRGDGNPLIMAAGSGHIDIVRQLLDAGADVDAAVVGDGNPLIAAAARGRLGVVRLLVDRGARIDAVVPDDETPLIQAAGHGHLDVVQFLVERGADVQKSVWVKSWRAPRTRRSPLGMAIEAGHREVADYLRRHGAVE